MTGVRRRVEYVVTRGIARAVAVGVLSCALGNLLALGCALAWLRAAGAEDRALWLIGAAAAMQFIGGIAALLAYGWAR